MKKLFLCAGISALLTFSFTFKLAGAAGINLEGLGTRAITMGGAFIGLADDSSAIYWNPAGLAQLKGGGFAVGVYSMSAEAWDPGSVSNLDPAMQDPNMGDVFPRVYHTEHEHFDDDKEFWPSGGTLPGISAYKSFDGFTLGGGVYAIAGAYSNWKDTMKDPVTMADIDASIFSVLMLMDFNASLAKKITDKLSLGVGLDLLYAKLQGNIEKDYRNSKDPMQPDYSFGIDTEADGIGLQGTMGFLYKFSPKWSLGGMFRTGAKFNLNGDLSAEQAIFGPDGKPVMSLEEKSNHYHEFVYPPSWGLGIAYKPTQTLTLTADWQRTDWTKFKWPFGDVHYAKEGQLLKNTVRDPDWYASEAYRFGLEYKYNKRLTLRGGYFTEDSGLPEEAEGLTTTFTGSPIQYVNVGFGYQWDVWNLDLMIGTMWGNTYTGVWHQCYDFAFTFSRQFGGESEGLPHSWAINEGEKVKNRESSFFHKELVFAPEYLFDGDNLRFRDIEPANSVGFEYLRNFSGAHGDWVTTDLQVRFPIMGHKKKLFRNASANFNLNTDFDQGRMDDALTTELRIIYEIHNAYANFKLNEGRSNIKIGHFDVPFGLEPLIDTHATLLQTQASKNIGFKQDWGFSVNGALPSFDYEVAATFGTGGIEKISREDGSFLLSGRVGAPSSENFQYGFSLLYGRIFPSVYGTGDYLFEKALLRKRLGLDGQYRYHSYVLKGEIAYGKDEDRQVLSSLFEIDYTLPKYQKWQLEAQVKSFINDLEKSGSDDTTMTLGVSFKVTDEVTLRANYIHDFNLRLGKEEDILGFQLYYHSL